MMRTASLKIAMRCRSMRIVVIPAVPSFIASATVASRVTSAAMAILKKTLPDLASIEHTGDGPRPFAVIPEVIDTAAEWEAKFKPKTEH
jgi:hypothetical protein